MSSPIRISPILAVPVVAWALLATAGTFAPTNAGPITADPGNPRWIMHDGAPHFLCGPGDPESFLHRGTRNPDGTRTGDQDTIIQAMIGSGANVQWMTAVRSHGGDGGSTENPFVNNDPAQGVSTAVLDQWEGWISSLDAAEITTFFVFYDDGTKVWNTGSSVGAAEEDFFRTVVDRFEGYDHIIWCVCEEYPEAFNTTRVEALAAILADADDADHPVSVHQHQGSEFHFPDDPSLDVFAMHTGYSNTPTSLHAKCVSAFDFAAGRYSVIMSESIYHYNNRTDARRLSWSAAMGGCTVMVHDIDPGAAPVEALEDCGRIVSFFEATPFHLMSPRDDLARGATDWVFGDPAVGYLVYASDPSGDLGISIPAGGAGNFDLHWMDCATGDTVEAPALVLGEGEHFVTKPSGLGSEVVVSVLPSTATSAGSGIAPATWAHIKAKYRPNAEKP